METQNYHIDPILFEKPLRIKEPYSWVGHIPFAFFLVKHHKPNVIVELGTHTGNSYFAFCQAVNMLNLPTKCFAIDTWKGDEHAGFYDEAVYEDVAAYNAANYNAFSTLLRKTFDEALLDFEDGSIDLLHIDGLHTYEAVKHDFESWLPKMSERGIVLLHDTAVRQNGFGVWRLWEELSRVYPSIVFPHSYGLGICRVGKALNKENVSFFEHFRDQPQLIHLFSKIGPNTQHNENTNQIKSKLYLPDDQDLFSESNTVIKKVTRETRHIQVLLKEPHHIKSFRFDPLEEPAIIQLQQVTLTTPEGQTVVLAPKAIRPGENAICIDQTYYFWDHDPQWIIDLDEPALVLSVEFFLNIEAIGEQVLGRINEVIAKERASANTSQIQIQNLQKEVTQVIGKMKYFEVQLVKKASENERLQIQLTELQSTQTSALQQAEKEINNQKKLAQELEALKNEHQILSDGLAHIQKEHTSLQQAYKSLEEKSNNENERLHIKLSELESTHNAALHQLEEGIEIQKKLTQQLDSLKTQKLELSADLNALQKDYHSLSQAHTFLSEGWEKEQWLMREQIEQTKKEIRSVQQSLQKKEEEHLLEKQRATALQAHSENLQQELSEIRQSISMRLGLGLTYVFRKLYDWFQRQEHQPRLPEPEPVKNQFTELRVFASQIGEELFISSVSPAPKDTVEIKVHLDNEPISMNPTTIFSNKNQVFFLQRKTEKKRSDVAGSWRVGESLGNWGPIPVHSVDQPTVLHCDKAELFKNNRLQLKGWTISVYPIISIDLVQHTSLLQSGHLTEGRPDVHQAFSSYPNWQPAGFSFLWQLPDDIEMNKLSLRVRLVGGASYSVAVHPTLSTRDLTLNEQYAILQQQWSAPKIPAKPLKPSFSVVRIPVAEEDGKISSASTWRAGIAGLNVFRILYDQAADKREFGNNGTNGLAEILIQIPRGASPWSGIQEVLSKVTTPYVLFFPNDYRIADYALFQLQQFLNKTSEQLDVLYFDEDKMKPNGDRVMPNFKPAYSPERLRNQDYIGPVIAIRSDILRHQITPDPSLELATTFDLILQAEKAGLSIRHVPILMAHQIIQQERTSKIAKNAEDLRFCPPRELEPSIRRSPFTGTSQPTDFDGFSLVILNKNAPEFIIPLLKSLDTPLLGKDYEVIVGDTGTTDKNVLKLYAQVENRMTVVKGLRYHFGKNYNLLNSQYARGKYLGLLNNDIILPNLDFLKKIRLELDKNQIGVVGSKLLYPDGALQHAGVFFREHDDLGFIPYHRKHGKPSNELQTPFREVVPAVTGAFLFCRKDDFKALGGFDPVYEEEVQDIDLCLKFRRAGMEVVFLNLDSIHHVENGTREKGSENWHDRHYYRWKWSNFLALPEVQQGIFEPETHE